MRNVLLVSASLLLLTATAANADTIHIGKAMYGVLDANGAITRASCDATPAMIAACNGKTFCQVYVDPRYLCPDPASGEYKSLVVTNSCEGKSETLSFPDTAQAILRCPLAGGQ
jgi:hypothetical protein